MSDMAAGIGTRWIRSHSPEVQRRGWRRRLPLPTPGYARWQRGPITAFRPRRRHGLATAAVVRRRRGGRGTGWLRLRGRPARERRRRVRRRVWWRDRPHQRHQQGRPPSQHGRDERGITVSTRRNHGGETGATTWWSTASTALRRKPLGTVGTDENSTLRWTGARSPRTSAGAWTGDRPGQRSVTSTTPPPTTAQYSW